MDLIKKVTGFGNDQKGLTAIELAVVVAILAVLASIVAGSTQGMSSNARGSTQSTDISEVQKAVDRYRSDSSTSAFPVSGDLTTLTQTTGLNFYAVLTRTGGITKTMVPEYLLRAPRHGDVVPSTYPTNTWAIDMNGVVTNTLAPTAY